MLLLSRRGLVATVLTALLVACADEPVTTSASSGNSDTIPLADGPLGEGRGNPVYRGDFADPYVVLAGSTYYAYSTNTRTANVPVLRSLDLTHWTVAGDALPDLPSWAESGRRLTWAPAVLEASGRYLLFFSTRDALSDRQCIGRAESASPIGPFVDQNPGPVICQAQLGGSIDPSLVRDTTGQVYILWKNDGNCCGQPVMLWSQRLSADGRALLGQPTELLQRDQPWEGPLIEGPTMWEEDGVWHLLYSANRWDSDRYATGYATCVSPLGPCRKTYAGPVMASGGEIAGPGGAETFVDLEGRRWLAYHAWTAGQVGYKRGGVRSLRIEPMTLATP
jgi:beta-xylosidase